MARHGLGRDDGFRRARRSLCLLREGELVVHEAPQADAYCYERRHRAAYAAWSSLALPHGPRPLPLLVLCVAPEAYGRAVDSTALDACNRDEAFFAKAAEMIELAAVRH